MELNDLGPSENQSSSETQVDSAPSNGLSQSQAFSSNLGKVRVNEGDAWYAEEFISLCRYLNSLSQCIDVQSSGGATASRLRGFGPLWNCGSLYRCCCAVRGGRRFDNVAFDHLGVTDLFIKIVRSSVCYLHGSCCSGDKQLS